MKELVAKLCPLLGLHPMVGFGMVAVDWMLFGGNVVTMGLGLAITVPFALALSLPCILIQRFSFGDRWEAALGKGMMVGVLTAVPSPLPSVLPLASGVLGATKLVQSRPPGE